MLDQSIYDKANEIIKKHTKDKEPLIPIMQEIQAIYNTIAPELLSYVAKELGISEEDAYSSANNEDLTFEFSLKGRYVISVCDGIACHAKKGTLILDHLYKELGLSPEKNTTDDLLFTVQPSPCLRSCGQAPVMMVNDDLYPSMTPEKATELINKLRVEFNDILEKGVENLPSGKAITLSGNLNTTGPLEIPAKTTIREIIDKYAGGLKKDYQFKAAQIGAAPGGCLITTDLDYVVDFDTLKSQGTMIRTRNIVIYDQYTCIVESVRGILAYSVENEVCGKCVPCREGTARMLEILEDIVNGRGTMENFALLKELGLAITDTALCKLGFSFVRPILSTIEDFEEEYIEHIVEKKCHTGSCKALANYEVVPSLCKGCSKCARNCPVSAISGEIKSPFVIDKTKCIKCGACATGCPFKAITIV